MLCSFGHLVLWISLRSQSELLYRLNYHDDKQPIVGDLFFVGLGLLGMAIHVSRSTHNSTIKPLIQSSPILFPDDKLALHVSVLNFQQYCYCAWDVQRSISCTEWLTYKHTMTTVCLWGFANQGINILLHAHSHNAYYYTSTKPYTPRTLKTFEH